MSTKHSYADYMGYLNYLKEEKNSIKEIVNTYHAMYGEHLKYDYNWKKGSLIFYISNRPGGCLISSEILAEIGTVYRDGTITDIAEELCKIIHPELRTQ